VVVRLRWHQPTRDYLARRTGEGKTKKEMSYGRNLWVSPWHESAAYLPP
jgi:hypothetical protein